MNIILLGYNGLIGRSILNELFKYYKKKSNFKLTCVGRNIEYKPYKFKKIEYIKWNFLKFQRSKLQFFRKKNIIINCIGKNHGDIDNLEKVNSIFIEKLVKYIKNNKISAHLIHLSSVSVYGSQKKYINQIKNISENTVTRADDLYSKSKLKADFSIERELINKHKNFSFTILRISNVVSELKVSNSFRLIKLLLNKGIWFRYSNNTNYHFINVKDVALSVLLCVKKHKKSKNKIYIVSDDINQFKLHKIYAKKFKLFTIIVPSRLLTKMIKYFPLPKKIFNFFLIISSQVLYNNNKIRKDLGFNPRYSLKDKIL